MDIERIDRIGMVVAQLEPQVELLEGLFGFTTTQRTRDDMLGVERVQMAVPGMSDIDWEVSAPTRPDSYLQSFIDGPLGPGLQYVLLHVRDLSAAVNDLRGLGIEPWSEQQGTAEQPVEEILIHPWRGGHGFQFRFRSANGAAPRMGPPPAREGAMGIVAVNHLSHAHGNRDELAGWYGSVFGMQSFYRSDDPGREFVTEVMETPTRQMRWEVIQPLGDPSFIAAFLERRGPTIHHITFEVADWEAAVAACAARGIRPFGEREGVTDGARWIEGFIHPRQTGGMLVQFFWQERPGVWV